MCVFSSRSHSPTSLPTTPPNIITASHFHAQHTEEEEAFFLNFVDGHIQPVRLACPFPLPSSSHFLSHMCSSTRYRCAFLWCFIDVQITRRHLSVDQKHLWKPKGTVMLITPASIRSLQLRCSGASSVLGQVTTSALLGAVGQQSNPDLK